jgi:hypothetical protein
MFFGIINIRYGISDEKKKSVDYIVSVNGRKFV